MYSYILSFLVAFLISVSVTPLVKRFAQKFQLVDDPKIRHQPARTHTGVVARAGGLAIFIALLVPILIFIPINKLLLGVLVGATLIVVTGLLDDYYDLSPYVRLALNVLVALVTILFGLGVPYLSNPFGGVIRLDQIFFTISFLGEHKFLLLANLFAVFWIVSLMNFINWSKGVDGQLPGFVAISCLFIGIFALRFSSHEVAKSSVSMIAFVTSGAFAGFLVWNMYPQKIMPGYSGGALAGFMLATLSILSFAKLGILLMVLSVPIIDALYVFVRRILAGQSPFKGDASHFHHRLLQIGWGRRRIAVFYWIISFIFGVSALYFRGEQKMLAFATATILIACFIFIIQRIKEDMI